MSITRTRFVKFVPEVHDQVVMHSPGLLHNLDWFDPKDGFSRIDSRDLRTATWRLANKTARLTYRPDSLELICDEIATAIPMAVSLSGGAEEWVGERNKKAKSLLLLTGSEDVELAARMILEHLHA
jgi:hypothetical protein